MFRAFPFLYRKPKGLTPDLGEEGAEGDKKRLMMYNCIGLLDNKALREFCNFRFASRVSTYLVSFFREGVAKDLAQERYVVQECEC